MYDLPSFIQPRIAGSSDKYKTLTRISPSTKSRKGVVVCFQSVGFGMPTGRSARRNCWFMREVVTAVLLIEGM